MSDERDPLLTALYRAAATEQPPRRLDEAVLAMARPRAGTTREDTGWSWFPRSWALPVAVMAVVVMAVSMVLVFHAEDYRDPLASGGPGSSAPPPSAPAPVAKSIGEVAEPPTVGKVAPERDSGPIAQQGGTTAARSDPRGAPAVSGPQPKPADPPAEKSVAGVTRGNLDAPLSGGGDQPRSTQVHSPTRDDGTTRGQVANRASERSVGGAQRQADSASAPAAARPPGAPELRPSADAAALPAPSAVISKEAAPVAPPSANAVPNAARTQKDEVSGDPEARAEAAAASRSAAPSPVASEDLTPEKWLARIEQLRREGRTADAKTALEEFRRRYPSYPVPKHLE